MRRIDSACSSRIFSKSSFSSLDFARIEARCRLVKAQQNRRGTHGPRDFEPPLSAVGEVARGIVGAVHKANLAKPIGRALYRFLLGALVALKSEKAAEGVAGSGVQDVMLRDEQVFEQGHPGKKPDVLERAGDMRRARDLETGHALQEKDRAFGRGGPLFSAEGDAGQCFEGCSASVRKRDPAFGRLVEPGDAVENRGLARTVGADDCRDVASAG